MNESDYNVRRLLVGYNKVSPNRIAVELDFKFPVTLSFLQKVFNEVSDDPMFDCYDIDKEIAKILQPYVDGVIDLEKYYFSLECYSLDYPDTGEEKK